MKSSLILGTTLLIGVAAIFFATEKPQVESPNLQWSILDIFKSKTQNCPSNQIYDQTSKACVGAISGCKFTGISSSRYIIVDNQCKQCQVGFYAESDNCVECLPNQVTVPTSNICLERSSCALGTNSTERIYIENHSCKVCSVNTVYDGSKCVECKTEEFAPADQNKCLDRNFCNPKGITIDRVFVFNHICLACKLNFVYDQSSGNCLECDQNRFSSMTTNICLDKTACSLPTENPDRIYIKAHSCVACPANFVYNETTDTCTECAQDQFNNKLINKCLDKSSCYFANVTSERYYVAKHSCSYCSENYIFDKTSGSCTRCSITQFSKLSQNTCFNSDYCQFEGVEKSRNYINLHKCGYCKVNEVSLGNFCVSCPSDKFATQQSNSCLSRESCNLPDVTASKVYVSLNTCMACENNFVLNQTSLACEECPDNQWNNKQTNTCLDRTFCDLTGISSERVFVKGHICTSCPVNTIYDSTQDLCVPCSDDQFTVDQFNSCLNQASCNFEGVHFDRIFVATNQCQYCQQDFIFDISTSSCVACPNGMKSLLDQNKCTL